MKKVLLLLAVLISISLVFVSCGAQQNTTNSANHNLFSKNVNRQIYATNFLDRESLVNNYKYYNFSKTNGNEILDKIYFFYSSPDDIGEENYENSFRKKYEYRYLNGDANSSINIRKYERQNEGDEPWYNYMHYFNRDDLNNGRLKSHFSFDIGTDCSIYSDASIEFLYDDNGRASGYTDYSYNGSTNFTYDEDGLLCKITESTSGAYKEFTFEKDGKGNLLTIDKCDYSNDIHGKLYENLYKHKYEYEYDSVTNNIKSETEYYINEQNKNKKESYIEYSYNDNGSISEIYREKFDSEKDDFVYTTEYYDYDENENLTRITVEKDNRYEYFGGNYEYIVFVYASSPQAYTDDEF